MALRFQRALTRLPRPNARPGNCARRTQLLAKLTGALDEVLLLYRRQQRAIANGDVLFRRLDGAIERCTARVQAARKAYWRHIRRHGC